MPRESCTFEIEFHLDRFAQVVEHRAVQVYHLTQTLDILVRDWARDQYTATAADTMIAQHPHYGLPASVAALADQGLLFASSEMAAQFGGFVEGALEAAEYTLKRL